MESIIKKRKTVYKKNEETDAVEALQPLVFEYFRQYKLIVPAKPGYPSRPELDSRINELESEQKKCCCSTTHEVKYSQEQEVQNS